MKKTSYDDDVLILRIASGDQHAFKEAYDRYWEKLFAISYNYSNNKELAEEAVQDVFMSLWDRREDVEIRSLSAYLATAVKFSILNQIQKEYRRRELLKEVTDLNEHVSNDLIIDALFTKKYIDVAVDALPEQCRIVYRYSREQGMNAREIGQEMHLAPKTVENHLAAALKVLRHRLRNLRFLIPVF